MIYPANKGPTIFVVLGQKSRVLSRIDMQYAILNWLKNIKSVNLFVFQLLYFEMEAINQKIPKNKMFIEFFSVRFENNRKKFLKIYCLPVELNFHPQKFWALSAAGANKLKTRKEKATFICKDGGGVN